MSGMQYSTPKWEKLRLQILRRDNYTCAFCGILALGKKRNGVSPTVDHIHTVKDRPDLAFDPENLRILCKSCDNKRHSEKGRGFEIPQTNESGFPEGSEWSDDYG